MLKFFKASYLYLLFLIPVLLIFVRFIFIMKKRSLKKFGEIKVLNSIMPDVSWKRQAFKYILVIIAITLIIIALARPQVGTKLEFIKRKGLDIIIAIDTSLSMLAEDIKPSRLSKAKKEIKNFIDRLAGDRVGIIAFAGKAVLICPLTTDYAAAKMLIDDIDVNTVSVQGTSICSAILLAKKAYITKDKKYKVLLIVTDGEDHEGKVIEAAKEAKADGIRIFTVGIGSPKGAPIQFKDKNGNIIVKKDKTGKIVMSKLDIKTLEKVAMIGNGNFYLARHGEMKKIFEKIEKMEKREIHSKRYSRYAERFQWPLFFALVLLIVEMLIPETVRNKFAKNPLIVLAFILVFVSSTTAYASVAEKIEKANSYYKKYMKLKSKGKHNTQEALMLLDKSFKLYKEAEAEKPDDPRINYNIGNIYFRQKKFTKAAEFYINVTKSDDEKLCAMAYYNLGNLYFEKQNYVEAIKMYKKALDYTPTDKDAKFNLELARRKLKEKLKQQKQNRQQQKSRKKKKSKTSDKKNQKKNSKKRDSKNKTQNVQKNKKKSEKKPKSAKKLKKPKNSKKKEKPRKKKELSEDEINRILNSLKEKREKLKKKKLQAPGFYILKDW